MTRLPLFLALAAAAAAALPGAAHAAGPAPGTAGSTFLASAAPGGLGALPEPVGDAHSATGATSADGRYVAFVSDSDALAGAPTLSTQAFVRDLVTGSVTLVGRATGAAGAIPLTGASSPSISDDGRRVAFATRDALDPADTNGVDDVYVRDLDAQTTTLVSRASGLGTVGDAESYGGVISGNGQYVAFESSAKNFSGADPDAESDIFRRRLGAGDATVLITLPKGAGTPHRSYGPAISDDGNVVAYTSGSTGKWLQTAIDDTNNNSDTYVRIVDIDETILASTVNGNASALTTGGTNGVSVSGDGQYVAYDSFAANSGTADLDTAADVFVRRLATAAVTLVSRPTGAAGTSDGTSWTPSLDQTGARVAFSTSATNLGDGDADAAEDIHVRDIAGATTTLVSRAAGPAGAKSAGADAGSASISDDGSTVAFTIEGGSGLVPGVGPDLRSVVARRGTDTLLVSSGPGVPLTSAGGESDLTDGGAISADGRMVAFTSSADGLSAEDDDRYENAFVRDTLTKSTVLVSRATGANGAAAAESTRRVVLSADGRRAAFVTSAKLDPADTNGKTDVYVRDMAAGTTTLASVTTGGGVANGDASAPALDADGSRLAFVSTAANLGDGDTTATRDVHVRDLAAGTTLWASVAAGGAAGNGTSGSPAISADGTRVAFQSAASNLGDGDADTLDDIHVRDLAASTTVLASRADGAAGAKAVGGQGSQVPYLSGDGTRVLFSSYGADLDPSVADGAGTVDAFVRDLAAGTTTLVDRQAGPAGAKATSAYGVALSADGNTALFKTYDLSFAPGLHGDDTGAIVARDIDRRRTRLAGAADGDAPLGEQYFSGAAVSGDGACVAFGAWGHGLVPGVATDGMQIYVHVLKGSCGLATSAPGGGDGGAPTPAPTPGADRVAPKVTGAKLSRKRFRVAKAATALSAATQRKRKLAPAGTKLSFSLSEAATTTITVERRLPGRRKGKACVKATKKLAKAKRCTRAVKAGVLTRKLKAGAASVAFSGRLGKRALARGSYQATIVAVDAAGNRSKPVTVTFTIVR